MKKSICLYFQVHQPTRLRMYRFFDIGKDSHYYDDFANRTILRRVAQKCYLPANQMLLDLIKSTDGAFKVAFSISGSFIEQCQRHCPDVIDSFRALAQTGCVEFLSETYYHSLASLASPNGFEYQVGQHRKLLQDTFGVTPVTFRNTELIYSDAIGQMVYEMGFRTMLTEGAKHVLGWKSPNFVYSSASAPKLKLLLRNASLSDDIAFRFNDRGSETWPLTCDKYLAWLKASAQQSEIVNLFMDYETIGEHQNADTGIFEFFKALPSTVLADGEFEFVTPAEASAKHVAVDSLEVPDPISWADEERDVSAWLGNELQEDAYNKLYTLTEKLGIIKSEALWADFGHLQESDHLYYMCTKFFSDGDVHKSFNPYDTPYEAFINYMNVLSDFSIRVEDGLKTSATMDPKVENVIVVKPKNIPGDESQEAPKAQKKTAAKKAPAKTATKTPAKKKTVKTK